MDEQPRNDAEPIPLKAGKNGGAPEDAYDKRRQHQLAYLRKLSQHADLDVLSAKESWRG